jgi:hypothetical protein
MKNHLQLWLLLSALLLSASCSPSSPESSSDTASSATDRPVRTTKQADDSVASAVSDAEGKKSGKTASVAFSHKRGFYDEPFELVLTCKEPGAQIRYTVDGSEPTASAGHAYAGPISIKSTGIVRAAAFHPEFAANVKAHSYIFPRDVLTQSNDGLPPTGWPYEWGDNRVDYGMDPRVANDPRYRDGLVEGLKALPSFSLVMDLNDLFHRERGIYSNAELDGKEAERPASLELIYSDGTKGFQIDCGVRIRGGFSRMSMNPKHAFRFFFRKKYGEGKLKYPLFGKEGAEAFDNIDLRCAQNYSWSLAGDLRGVFLRDQFNRDLQLAMGEPAARGNFCHLYINGQYWGLYNTCERPEASFAETYLGGSQEDYDVIKPRGGFGRGGENSPFVTDGTIDAWKRLWTAAKKGLASNEAYFRLQGKNPDGSRNSAYEVLLDPVNLIDYMLVILYGGNFDAPISRFMGEQHANNWYGVRNRNGEAGFKFFVWDAEHTLLDLQDDRTGPFPAGDSFQDSNPQWLWQQCLENAEFRMLVADRVHRHFHQHGVLTPKALLARFEQRKNEIEKAVVCESARWGDAQEATGGFMAPPRVGPDGKPETGPLTKEHWSREVHRLTTDYFPKRTEVVLKQLWNVGLWPDTEAPVFQKDGSRVEVKAPRGKIFYTLDGSDPRGIGGTLSPRAKPNDGPLSLPMNGVAKARVLVDEDWSPLTEEGLSSP